MKINFQMKCLDDPERAIEVSFDNNIIILSIVDKTFSNNSVHLTKEEGKHLTQFLQQLVYCTNEPEKE